MQDFIDDGYEETVGINAVAGLHNAMEFTRRPFAGDEGTEAFRRIQIGPTKLKLGAKNPTAKQRSKMEKEAEPGEVKSRLFEVILERVSTWGYDRELSAENLNKLPGRLFERFHNVVFGYDAPDYRMVDGVKVDADDVEDAELEDAKN